jgi:ribosomal protein S18 acetylase RimI-like enzyme
VPDTSFRIATVADVPAVAALVERAYRGPVAATGWTTETGLLTGPRSSEQHIAELAADPASRFVLAEVDGALVGSALVQAPEAPGGAAYLGMFAVDPAHQGGGVGRAVVAAAERTVREMWGAPAVRLTVISLRAELIRWYERRGFVRTGRHLPFPFHEASGALRTDFDLVEMQKTFGQGVVPTGP